MNKTSTLADEAFDLRVRAEMALAFEPGLPPEHLLRHSVPWTAQRHVQHAIVGLLLVAFGSGTVMAMRPSELIRHAIAHETNERSLRGMPLDSQQLLQELGLGSRKVVPGFPQMMRICDVEGHKAYHLTTFFEKGGMVTVLAFDKPIHLQGESGWWNGAYWRIISSREGKPLLLIAQNKDAINAAQPAL